MISGTRIPLKIIQKSMQTRCSKMGAQRENDDRKRGQKIDAKKGRDDATAWGGRRVWRDAASNVLNISKRLVFVL